MKEKLFIDSNIFIYAADKEALFYDESVGILRDSIQTGLYTSDLCILEFYQVITDGRKTPNPLPPQDALLYVEKLWNTPEIDVFEADILAAFLEEEHQENLIRYNITKFDIYDYLIAVCLKKNRIKKIATFNAKDFKKYPWLTVVDPREIYGSRRSAPCTLLPAPRFIPYGRQSIDERDVAAVCNILRSDFLTQGPTVPTFEKAVAQYCGAEHAVAVSNGTAALHLACMALNVGPGDLVWTSPITFVASANCALYCGAEVDFVDIDPRTYNLSPKRLEEKLKTAKAAGRLPKVVIPVHLAGQPCDMAAIYALSQEYGFRIIEDACHAIGGRYKNEPIGNCRYSDITVFSFHPVKTITTAEGGMAVTNDPELSNRMARLRTHGITRDPTEMTHAPDGPWYYQQIELGFNFRMADLQAALGISQLNRLDEFVAKRHAIAQRYDRLLADLHITTPWQHPDAYSGLHLYVIQLKLNEIRKTHREVFDSLRAAGIGVNLHYIPVYSQPYYKALGFKPGYGPEAERYYARAISLPMYPGLTEAQQDHVVSALRMATSV
jgi:UDP-4-amino-4,6-dideoxy-N-acetyl-beta-L-altrosamine transaminase